MPTRVSPSRAQQGAAGEIYAIDESLGYLLNRAARLMAHGFAERLTRHGVALGQWAILLFLYARDGQTQADLSRVVAIEPPTVARTIERMERDGLIRREPDPVDRRATRVYLAPRAVQLKEALLEESQAANADAARVLSVEELQTFQALLRRVIAGLS